MQSIQGAIVILTDKVSIRPESLTDSKCSWEYQTLRNGFVVSLVLLKFVPRHFLMKNRIKLNSSSNYSKNTQAALKLVIEMIKLKKQIMSTEICF